VLDAAGSAARQPNAFARLVHSFALPGAPGGESVSLSGLAGEVDGEPSQSGRHMIFSAVAAVREVTHVVQ
jgi:hypothetical protein